MLSPRMLFGPLLILLGNAVFGVTLTTIVDVGSVLPGSSGTHSSCGDGPPNLSDGQVLFASYSAAADVGLYIHDQNGYHRVIDRDETPVAGITGGLGLRTHTLKHGRIAFRHGQDRWFEDGNWHGYGAIIVWEQGTARIVVDTNMLFPGTNQYIIALDRSWPGLGDDNSVVFQAHSYDNVHGFGFNIPSTGYTSHDGIFVEKNGVFTPVAVRNGSMLYPGSDVPLGYSRWAVMDGDAVSFRGLEYNDGSFTPPHGILYSRNGTLSAVATTSTTLPGSTQLFTSFAPEHSLDGEDVAFSNLSGVYARINGQLMMIADLTTTAPGTQELFDNFFWGVSIDNGIVAFTAQTTGGKVGVYCGDGVSVTKVVDSDLALDNRYYNRYRLHPDGLENGQLVFAVRNGLDSSHYTTVILASDLPGARGSRIRETQLLGVTGPGGHQTLEYNYDTAEIDLSPYSEGSGQITGSLPADDWQGLFFYDYATSRFSEALFRLKVD